MIIIWPDLVKNWQLYSLCRVFDRLQHDAIRPSTVCSLVLCRVGRWKLAIGPKSCWILATAQERRKIQLIKYQRAVVDQMTSKQGKSTIADSRLCPAVQFDDILYGNKLNRVKHRGDPWRMCWTFWLRRHVDRTNGQLPSIDRCPIMWKYDVTSMLYRPL